MVVFLLMFLGINLKRVQNQNHTPKQQQGGSLESQVENTMLSAEQCDKRNPCKRTSLQRATSSQLDAQGL